ncbi:MAG: acetyltransferase [Elusimicrobia bacterium RIFOXYA1_FULL_47_7]|nr:MAG: acetyltransferase [Elusimicrobia bacterium RIFOXYA1_FULL_47_7]
MLRELFRRIHFWNSADRIGPDIPTTHWRLFFKSTMLKLCKKRFKHFDESAEFRPGAYATPCSNISLGKNVIIRPETMLFAGDEENAGIIIEDDVMMGSGVHIYCTTHCFNNPDAPIINQGFYPSKPVVLKKGCWLGANCIILPGVTVGENSVVGAGSIVPKDVPSKVLAAGNPAKVIRALHKNI